VPMGCFNILFCIITKMPKREVIAPGEKYIMWSFTVDTHCQILIG
jgi:hypothetical protein